MTLLQPRSIPFTPLRNAALLFSLAFLPSFLASQDVPPRPAPVRATWAQLVGEFIHGDDTVSVSEYPEGLVLLTHDGGRALREKENGTFTADGLSLVFDTTGLDASVRMDGTVYRKLRHETIFRIEPQFTIAELRARAAAATPPVERGEFRPSELVDIARLDTTIHFEIRYATARNFMGEQFYSSARAFLQRPAAHALVRAHRQLAKRGFGIIVYDAYRPWTVTKMFWDATPPAQRDFVANPARGSKHNRGCAVDIGLYDLRTGRTVEMPSGYDEFSSRAYADYPGGTVLERWHRLVLRRTMEREGFHVESVEWWHFDFGDWKRYAIQNTQFEDIR